MLNSAELGIYPAHNFKIGILTLISRKSVPFECNLIAFQNAALIPERLLAVEISCSAELSMKKVL